MKANKIIWFEGMKLDPHHFQQTDHYNTYYLNSRLDLINSNLWGLKNLTIDSAALSSGNFNIIACNGIMPDGAVFNIPENDSIPQSRNFEKIFDSMTEHLDVYLVIPLEQVSGRNFQLDEQSDSNLTRYHMQKVDCIDLNIGANIKTIGVAKPNYQFRFGNESLEDFSSIKLGEIVRTSDGKYVMENQFIPSCVEISASRFLLECLRNTLSSFVSKSKELKKQASIQKPELTLLQIEIYLFWQAINSFIPILNYCYNSRSVHPESLYKNLLHIIGNLSTFSPTEVKLESLPIYDHKHLTEVFKQLVEEIQVILSIKKTVERRDISIQLRKQGDSLYIGQLLPNQMSGQLFMCVTSDMPEKKVISELPKNVKISAYEEIFAVHQAGIQGLNIEYVARPPSGISINEKAHYFKIICEGRFWEKILSKGNIALFIASEFKSLQVELIILLKYIENV